MSPARQLRLQRELLVIRAGIQRLQMRRDVGLLAVQLSPAGWAMRAWDGARSNAVAWLLAAAGVAAARRTGMSRMLMRGFAGWRMWQRARQWLVREGPR